MKIVTYTYFMTPSIEALIMLFDSMINAGLSLDVFDIKDPPRKKNLEIKEMITMISSQVELNKYACFIDKKNRISGSIDLHYDKRWEWSTISIGGNSDIALLATNKLCECINPYLSIYGIPGMGKDQKWITLKKSTECPGSLLNIIKSAQQGDAPEPATIVAPASPTLQPPAR